MAWWWALAAVAAAGAVVSALGALRLWRLQIVVANLCLVTPINILLAAVYVILTPIRFLYYRELLYYFTKTFLRMAGDPAPPVTFWSADWPQFFHSVPGAFKQVIGADCMGLSVAEMRAALRQAVALPPYPAARAKVESAPEWLRYNLCVQLLAGTLTVPLSWFLNGWSYLPLLSMRMDAPDPLGGPAPPDPAIVGPSVTTAIRRCKFLKNARATYGEEGGVTACLNECKTGLEEMLGAGLLGQQIRVVPDLATGFCQFHMDPVAATCAKGAPRDIEDLL